MDYESFYTELKNRALSEGMALFGVGKIIFGQLPIGLVFLLLAAVSGGIIYWDLNRRGWKTVLE